MAEEGFSFFFVFGGRRDSDGETKDVLGFLVGSLWENDVLLDAHRDVPHFIYGLRIDTTKVFGSREDNVYQFLQKIIGTSATERDLVADDIAGARFEIRDRFLRTTWRRRLSGDAGKPVDDKLESLLVFVDLTDADRDDDLLNARGLHRALVAEFLLHGLVDIQFCGCDSHTTLIPDRFSRQLACARHLPRERA